MRKLKLLFAACALVLGVTSMQAKTDITSSYLKDADLSSLQGWGNPGRTDWKTNGAVNVVEFWNWSNQFTFEQEVTMPAGYYRLAVNAFYRNGGQGDGTNNNMAWIFAGEQKKNVVALTSMSELSGYAGSNDLYRAATAFSQGKYSNEFDFDLAEETTFKIGFKGTCPNSGWCILGPVTLYEYTADDYMEDYRTKVAEAEALYSTPMWAADLAALRAAVVEESTLTTVNEVKSAITTLSSAINAANSSIITYAAAIVPFNKIKAQADAIAAVEYTETTAGSHDTFTTAIEAQQTAATNAVDAAAITAAVTALKDAVKAYVNAAEPKNDGEYFDVTCLMVNPDFDDNNITGWTKESTLNPNTRIQCNEFYGKAAFDFYQTVDGLPNGSYTLSMKAFQRPGSYNAVYADYANGINGATAKVYVNSDESDVKNIMAEMNDEIIYSEGETAFNTDKKPEGAPGYIPNSMEGAAAWFAAGKYQSTAAALVENGTLKLGFKDQAHEADCWTLFDEFRLRYYGSSKMIYYKQQLPAIKAAANEDLNNALYANVTGKERADFEAAIAATPAEETEAAYKAIIDDITAKQTAFREAAPIYDAYVAALAAANVIEEGTIPTAAYYALNQVVTQNTLAGDVYADDYYTAAAAINAAVANAQPLVAPYATWLALKAQADELAGDEHQTIKAAIAKVASAVETMTTVEDLEEVKTSTTAIMTSYLAWYELVNYANALVAVESNNAEAKATLSEAISTQATSIASQFNKINNATIPDKQDLADLISLIPQATANLKTAMIIYAGVANPVGDGAQFDLTFMLTNPDVSGFANETKNVPGWYSDYNGNIWHQAQVNRNAVSLDGTKNATYEFWSTSAVSTGDFTVYQKVNLPVGTYNMSCYAFADANGVEGATQNEVYFFANDTQGSKIVSQKDKLVEASITFVNSAEQDVKIGLRALTGNQYRWMGIGYVKLYKIPAQSYVVDEDADWDNTKEGAGNVTLKRAIKEGVNTLVLPFSMTQAEVEEQFGEGSEVYVVSAYDADKQNISFSTQSGIQPNKPCLLKATQEGTSYTIVDRTIVAGDPVATGTNVTMTGNYTASFVVPEGKYIISGGKIYNVNSTVTLKNTRAYIELTAAEGARALTFTLDGGETTGIATLENGELKIETGAIYDLSGRRVNAASKGVYIINGKKVVK